MNEDIKLWHGDCLELMKDIPDKSVDAIICDLPYGTTACKWDTIIPFDKLWKQYNRIIKDNGAIVLFGKQPFTSELVLSNRKFFRYELIYEKPNPSNPLLAKKRFMSFHENILVFYKKQPTYNVQKEKREDKNKRDNTNVYYSHPEILGCKKIKVLPTNGKFKHPSSVLKFNRELGLHPTQKPVALIEYLIKTYSNEGDLILDNTSGSMTTAIAAINTNRRCICIEKDDHYFEIGSDRVRKHLQEQQLKLF